MNLKGQRSHQTHDRQLLTCVTNVTSIRRVKKTGLHFISIVEGLWNLSQNVCRSEVTQNEFQELHSSKLRHLILHYYKHRQTAFNFITNINTSRTFLCHQARVDHRRTPYHSAGEWGSPITLLICDTWLQLQTRNLYSITIAQVTQMSKKPTEQRNQM